MCEAVIQGFNTSGGMFTGLSANKIAVGLPACTMAAGGGFTDTATVKAAINYLRGNGSQPGTYTLVNPSGYPALRGMMTWSINWDAVTTCGTEYEFADNFQSIFQNTTSIVQTEISKKSLFAFPNPTSESLQINNSYPFNESKTLYIYTTSGVKIFEKASIKEKETVDLSDFPSGVYILNLGNYRQIIIKQ